MSQSLNNTDKIFDRQQSRQTLIEELTDKLDFQIENNASILSSRNNNEVDYAKLVVKKRAKTKNLEVKREHLILQKRNKRLQESIRDDKVASQEQYRRYINNANKDSFDNIFALKK